MKYRVVVGGEPSGCPNRIGINDSTHEIISRELVNVGDLPEKYTGQIPPHNCYSWQSGFSCDDVECNFGRIVSVEEIK
jgi:hypothetical protein